jgi:hypothetical protein
MLRQTLETTSGGTKSTNIRNQEDGTRSTKRTEEHHLTPAVGAFEAIGWKIPHSALSWFYTSDAQDLLEGLHEKDSYGTQDAVTRTKPREFYITSSIGMKPPKIAIENGVVIYTELPITLDDKVDKLQINYDYQQHMEEAPTLNRGLDGEEQPQQTHSTWEMSHTRSMIHGSSRH